METLVRLMVVVIILYTANLKVSSLTSDFLKEFELIALTEVVNTSFASLPFFWKRSDSRTKNHGAWSHSEIFLGYTDKDIARKKRDTN